MDGVITAKCGRKKISLEKMVLIAAALAAIPVMIVVGSILFKSMEEPVITVTDVEVQITGLFGVSIELTDISDVSLAKKSMDDIGFGKRISGSGGLGGKLKGHFRSEELGDILLFVQQKSSPTIRIERTGGKDVYISFSDAGKTELLYHQLLQRRLIWEDSTEKSP